MYPFCYLKISESNHRDFGAASIPRTNHAYWNLKGHQAGNVLDHVLMVAASRTTATDETLAITGASRKTCHARRQKKHTPYA